MPVNKDAPDLNEDEVAACIKQLATTLHELMNEGTEADALLSALNMRFAEMLNARGGRQPVVVDVQALYPTFSKSQWEQTELCHVRMKSVCEMLAAEGLSEDAIIWSLIGAIRNVLRISGLASDAVDRFMTDILNQFHAVRHPQVIHL